MWQDQIQRFPELRPAFIRLDTLNNSQGYVQTRFAGIEYKNGERYHDVRLMFEVLRLESEDVIQAILHSVVHCLNYDRGVNDTDGMGHHNNNFKETAHEVGLDTFWAGNFGWLTKVGDIKKTKQYQLRKNSFNNIKPFRFVEPNGVVI